MQSLLPSAWGGGKRGTDDEKASILFLAGGDKQQPRRIRKKRRKRSSKKGFLKSSLPRKEKHDSYPWGRGDSRGLGVQKRGRISHLRRKGKKKKDIACNFPEEGKKKGGGKGGGSSLQRDTFPLCNVRVGGGVGRVRRKENGAKKKGG